MMLVSIPYGPACGAADVEMEDTSVENPELKGSPYKAWRGSVSSLACSAN